MTDCCYKIADALQSYALTVLIELAMLLSPMYTDLPAVGRHRELVVVACGALLLGRDCAEPSAVLQQ